MPKSLNPNRVKIHRNYTVEEVACLLDVHKNTVRAWIKDGLPVCDDRRPTLILGAQLRIYLQEKRQCRKQRCLIDEMYCMRCREPKRPAGDMVDLAPVSASANRLTGLCPACGSLMNRFASDASLERIKQKLDVCIPQSLQHINKSNPLPVNSDFK
ncbi:MAG: hypothetical protein PsegKO_08290 [Pseudohongiellaceae bacterium]